MSARERGLSVVEMIKALEPTVTNTGDLAELRAAVDALLRERSTLSWRPIETAPLTGEMIILFVPEGVSSTDCVGFMPFRTAHVFVGWWDGGLWASCFLEDGSADSEGFSSQFCIFVKPTHWMPLPEPPGDVTIASADVQTDGIVISGGAS